MDKQIYKNNFAIASIVRNFYCVAGVFICLIFYCLLAGCESSADGASGADYISTIGRTGSGDGEFIYPRAIAFRPDGSFHVADKTGRIQRFSHDGEFISAITMPKIKKGKPCGISIGPDGNLYVADTHYHRITVFDEDGNEIHRFGMEGKGEGEFIFPTDVEFYPKDLAGFAKDGKIYVSEYGGNDRVSVFSNSWEFLFTFGHRGDGEGEFSRPASMCIAKDSSGADRLFIADSCNHRIARYTLDGKLLGYIGSSGNSAGQLLYPQGLALANDGRIIACEYGNNRLQIFRVGEQGNPACGTLGSAGRNSGQLAYPWSVATDGKGRIYVVDSGNNQVQVWELPGG